MPDTGFRESAPRPSAVAPAAGLARATRILVVEDEPDIGGLIAHALERDGQTSVELVPTGDAALAAIAERPPDVVVLDLNLPRLDGYGVLSQLRSRRHTANLPVLVLTADGDEESEVRVFQFGASDFLTKPFRPRALSARLKSLLRRAVS